MNTKRLPDGFECPNWVEWYDGMIDSLHDEVQQMFAARLVHLPEELAADIVAWCLKNMDDVF